MQLELLKDDLETIESLLTFGVLQDVKGELLNRKNGVVYCACSDGDQFHDRYCRQSLFQMEQRADHPRIHPLTLNGGPLLCHPKSPLVNVNSTLAYDYYEMLFASTNMKETWSIILEGHAPCAAARKIGLSLFAQLDIQMYVSVMARHRGDLENIDIVDHFHLSYGCARKRTHFINPEKWNEWLPHYGKKLVA